MDDDLDKIVEAKRQEMNLPATPAPKPIIDWAERDRDIAEQQAERDRRWAEARPKRRNLAWQACLRHMGTDYAGCRLESYVVKYPEEGQGQVLAQVREYAANIAQRIEAGINVMLSGPSRTGKDHLMAGLIYAAIQSWEPPKWNAPTEFVEFRYGPELWPNLRNAMASGKSEDTVVQPLILAPVLAISDPLSASGPLTDYQTSTLLRIVNARHTNRRPTWITVNLESTEEAMERMSAPLVKRLKERALSLACGWPSWEQGNAR